MFVEFSLISDFLTFTPLKIIFEISPIEQISCGFMMYSDFQEKVCDIRLFR